MIDSGTQAPSLDDRLRHWYDGVTAANYLYYLVIERESIMLSADLAFTWLSPWKVDKWWYMKKECQVCYLENFLLGLFYLLFTCSIWIKRSQSYFSL